jgi:hypothetical protein
MRTRGLAMCLLVIALSLVSASLLAAEETGSAAPESQGVVANAKGWCYYYDDRQLQAWVTIGSDHGLRPGARVAFLRQSEVVAEGEVMTVRAVDCVVRPDKDTPAGTILRGDDVKVTTNGTRAAMDAQLGHERNTRSLGAVFFSGLLLYLIML